MRLTTIRARDFLSFDEFSLTLGPERQAQPAAAGDDQIHDRPRQTQAARLARKAAHHLGGALDLAKAGFYTSPWGKHPRIQLLTVGELLAGKGINYPHVTGSNITLRRAQRAQGQAPVALPLFGSDGPANDDGEMSG